MNVCSKHGRSSAVARRGMDGVSSSQFGYSWYLMLLIVNSGWDFVLSHIISWASCWVTVRLWCCPRAIDSSQLGFGVRLQSDFGVGSLLGFGFRSLVGIGGRSQRGVGSQHMWYIFNKPLSESGPGKRVRNLRGIFNTEN